MRVTGVVIYLAHTPDAEASVRDSLAARGGFEVGATVDGHRLPAVLESPDARAERAGLDWLKDLPAVRMVSVAYAWFGEAAANLHHEEARS